MSTHCNTHYYNHTYTTTYTYTHIHTCAPQQKKRERESTTCQWPPLLPPCFLLRPTCMATIIRGSSRLNRCEASGTFATRQARARSTPDESGRSREGRGAQAPRLAPGASSGGGSAEWPEMCRKGMRMGTRDGRGNSKGWRLFLRVRSGLCLRAFRKECF